MATVNQISQLVLVVERLSNSVEKTNERHDKFEDKIDAIKDDVSKFAVLFEKQLNLEKTHEDSNKRLHHRVDEFVERIKKVEHTQEVTGCPVFREMQKERLLFIKQLEEEKEDIKKAIKEIQDTPKKRMENVLKGFFVALGGGIFAWIMAHWRG